MQEGSFDEMMGLNKELNNARGVSMYQRNPGKGQVDLKDFVIKSVIGKGSFGKVFLV